jgi:hypothetical protein
MNKGGFSWKRVSGISVAKSRVSRKIGIPLTRSGRERKMEGPLQAEAAFSQLSSYGHSWRPAFF